MPRLRTSLLLLAASVLLVVAGLGATLHAHEEAGQSCRLCQSIQGPDLPDADSAFLGDLVVVGSRPAGPRPFSRPRVVLVPVHLRAPPRSLCVI